MPLNMTSISFSKTATRYELKIDGQVGSYADYVAVGDAIELPHTATDPRFRGQGLAGKLIRYALNDLRDSETRIIPTCEFVARFVDDHPEYHLLRLPVG
jgi:uncharacterized protein